MVGRHAKHRTRCPGSCVPVVAAVVDIPRGTVLTAAMLGIVEVPRGAEGAYVRAADAAVGQVARVDVEAMPALPEKT